ncbi:hypothetical protein SUGI_1074910 [Cryptomeria japonica]|nr:hypothetical protein SUGI_1074910 [Cryptomeria japonica]
MSKFQSVFYPTYENSADIYSFDPLLMSQLQNNPILSPINEQLDQHGGFDNLLDMELTTEFGMVEHHHAQLLQDHTLTLPMGSEQTARKEELVHNAHTMPCLKKLSHNANERLRRKKLNGLYAQLQSLLPNSNPKRRLSIPNTVCGILNYIPELRTEIQILRRQRDKLISSRRISESSVTTPISKAHRDHSHSHGGLICSPPAIKVNCAALKHSEVLMTVYACKAALELSRLLMVVEEEGLEVLNASKFVSHDTVSFILHLQMTRSTVAMEDLQKKIVLSFENSLPTKGQDSTLPEKWYLTNCQQSQKYCWTDKIIL